jgi:hypothetical protein
MLRTAVMAILIVEDAVHIGGAHRSGDEDGKGAVLPGRQGTKGFFILKFLAVE